jgi:hypothetical protein
MEINSKYTDKLFLILLCKITITNLVTVQNFEAISDTFNLIGGSKNYAQK